MGGTHVKEYVGLGAGRGEHGEGEEWIVPGHAAAQTLITR